MSTQRDKWHDSDDPERFARGAGWFGLKWGTIFVIAILALSAAIGAVAWAAGVFTSDIKGRGDTIVRKNSANNRISAQAFFEDTYATVKAQDRKIDIAQQALADFQQTPRPSEDVVKAQQYDQQLQQLRNEARGLQSICQDAVASYDSEARKTIRSQWRSDDLPYQIDTSDPDTDCQASAAQ